LPFLALLQTGLKIPHIGPPPVFRIYPTLSVYIGRHFLMALLGTLLVIMGLILLLDFIELMRRAAGRPGVDMVMLFTMALCKLPNMIHTVLPFAVLVGSMIAMWRLTRSHELVVMRSVGVSIWQFLAPVMVVIASLGALDVMVINPLSASLYKTYERMEDRLILNHQGAFDLSKEGMWLREPISQAALSLLAGDGQAQDKLAGGQVVVHAGNVRQEDLTLHMRRLSFMVVDGTERFVRRFDAASGVLENGQFALNDVWEMEAGKPGRHFDQLSLPTNLTLGRVQENFASPETLSFWELPRFMAFFEAAGFSAHQHRMYWYSLLASPFLLCAMVLMAAVFSVSPNQRSGGGFRRVVGGVSAGFLLYFFTRLTFALGLSGTLPLWLAASSPTLITVLLGTATLLHMEDG
jgi:lipopolysaccharide export system permease protein